MLYQGVAITNITGLGNLEAKQVVVWADGVDVGTNPDGSLIYTVAGGAINLAVAASNVVVGLPYTAKFQSSKLLDLQLQGEVPLNKEKAIRALGLVMANVHPQGLSFGKSFASTDLYPLPLYENGALVNQTVMRATYDENRIDFAGDWDTDSRLCLQAVAPRPVTILSAVLEVET